MSTPTCKSTHYAYTVRPVCGFIRDTPPKPYQYAHSPRLRAAAGDKCCADAIKKPLRSVVKYPARQPDVGPAKLGEQLVALDVPRPTLRIGPVMCSLEVDAHEIFRPAHVDSGKDKAVLAEHSDLGLGPGEAGLHQQQASERFVR